MKLQMPAPAPAGIETLIIEIRREKVILDADLARIYGVPTKALNQAVKRNRTRFPEDFMFTLTAAEMEGLNRSQFVTGSQRHRNPRFAPLAFTEHGAMMAANVLNSDRGVEMGVYVICAFVKMRAELAKNQDLARRLAEIEKTLIGHDTALRDLYNKIRPMLVPGPEPKRREIGFHAKPDLGGQARGRKK